MDEDILNALCGNKQPQSNDIFAPDISIKEQCDFLSRNINFLSKVIRKKICKIPMNAGYQSMIHQCNEGIAMQLDLPDNIISEMYCLCYFELKRL
jgi:hypothetical protein